jgi:hypothetical protein
MLTISALLVRTEFCVQVEESGGIEVIHEVMTNFTKNEVRIFLWFDCKNARFFFLENNQTVL